MIRKKVFLGTILLGLVCMALPTFAMTKKEFNQQAKVIKEETKTIQNEIKSIQNEIKNIRITWTAVKKSKKEGKLAISKENFNEAKQLVKDINQNKLAQKKTAKEYNAENKKLKANGEYEKVLDNLQTVQKLKNEKLNFLSEKANKWKQIYELIK